jgi:hypothetical protein
MEGLDSGGQGPTSGCCAIEEEESFQLHYGPGVDSASNRNKYQEGKGQPAHKADNLTTAC